MSKPQSWYTIRAKRRSGPPDASGTPVQSSAEILIYGDIGESWYSESVSAAQFVRELQAIDATQITIRIASLGGSVPDGIAIYNAVKRHPANITCVVDSTAMSIASLIAIAGDQVEMAENAVLMIHAPWTWADGNAAQLRELADMLDVWARAMATSYAAKCGKPFDEVLQLLTDGVDHYYTAAEAQAAGFIDQVVTSLPLVAIADPAAASAYANRVRAQQSPRGMAPQTQEPLSMPSIVIPTPPTNSPAPQNNDAALAAARTAGITAEAGRRSAIQASFQRFAGREGMADIEAACLADVGISSDEADKRILAQLGRQASPVGQIVTTEDERDKFRAASVQAILARAAVRDAAGAPVRMDTANPMRGMTLMDMARACLQRAGVNASGMDRRALVAAAFTQGTSDFPVLLENAMYKTLQAGYTVQPDTWTRFCMRGTVGDFRANPRYRVGSLSNLDAKTELGEFRNKTIPDGEKASITASTKGNIINISREAVINDDMGVFIGLANSLGRAAKRTIEADAYALLLSNPVLNDGLTLFHASHGNYVASGAGAAPSVMTLDAARIAMKSQKDVSGSEYLDMTPAVALAPLSLGNTLKLLNSNEYDPSTTNKFQVANVVRGLFRDVVDSPRLSGTGWYMFADPNEAPVLEVAFLDGIDAPYLEMQNGWEVDGSAWKVRLDYGVGAIDYRGAYFNFGA